MGDLAVEPLNAAAIHQAVAGDGRHDHVDEATAPRPSSLLVVPLSWPSSTATCWYTASVSNAGVPRDELQLGVGQARVPGQPGDGLVPERVRRGLHAGQLGVALHDLLHAT